MSTRFEWDDVKADDNFDKHGVSFDEAATVFDDPLARIFYDELHSNGEHREIIIGQSIDGHLLVIVFTERLPGVVRIISARGATRRERRDYEENT